MCSNFAWEPIERQRRSTFIVRNCYCVIIILFHMKYCIYICFVQLPLLQTPPPLCDFEEWIDTEIKDSDKRLLQGLRE
jgi:hypothetical protein